MSQKKYKVIFGRFGFIMPQPEFYDFVKAKAVAVVHQGRVIELPSGKEVYNFKTGVTL